MTLELRVWPCLFSGCNPVITTRSREERRRWGRSVRILLLARQCYFIPERYMKPSNSVGDLRMPISSPEPDGGPAHWHWTRNHMSGVAAWSWAGLCSQWWRDPCPALEQSREERCRQDALGTTKTCIHLQKELARRGRSHDLVYLEQRIWGQMRQGVRRSR